MPGYPRPRTVPPCPLADIAAVIRATIAPPGIAVTGVTHASRSVRPGDLFAALPGSSQHGARFVPEAAAAGAVAVLTDPAGAGAAAAAGLPALVVDDPRAVLGPAAALVYGRPTQRLAVIGVTGTAGKTSTVYLLEAGLRAAGHRSGLIGTVETRMPGLAVDSERTTPEAGDLQALFASAVERGVTAVAMEVSSHALALHRVAGTTFAVGGYTNFGTDHLDFHGSREAYFAAKALLFDGRCRDEVINLDDPALRPLIRPTTITYSAAGDPAATWRADRIEATGFGQRFIAYGPDGIRLSAAVAMPGRHNVANALLALAALVATGIDPDVAAAGIAECAGVPGRLERVPAAGGVLGVVDYAHKPDAIVAALGALRESMADRVSAPSGVSASDRGSTLDRESMPDREPAAEPPGEAATPRDGIPVKPRLICVIGAGGDRDRGKRPVMGAAAARGADVVLVTDDNPRQEDPAVIRAEVLRGALGVQDGAEVIEVAGRRYAITEAVRRARPGDVVALLGKGHERGQEVAGEVHPFDDRVELANALAERFGPPPTAPHGGGPLDAPGTAPAGSRTGGGV